jgi:hypothetical protein
MGFELIAEGLTWFYVVAGHLSVPLSVALLKSAAAVFIYMEMST